MRGYDIWHKEREAAEVLPCGVRVYREDVPLPMANPRPLAAIWHPKATNPTAGPFTFRSIEQREAWIAEQIARFEAWQQRKAEQRAAHNAEAERNADLVQIGHIFCYSWGYDQTNIEYFQVIDKHGRNVVIRRIASSAVPGSDGFMCNSVEPRIGHFLADAKPLTKRPYYHDGRAYLSFEFGCCQMWRGGSHYQSWYA